MLTSISVNVTKNIKITQENIYWHSVIGRDGKYRALFSVKNVHIEVFSQVLLIFNFNYYLQVNIICKGQSNVCKLWEHNGHLEHIYDNEKNKNLFDRKNKTNWLNCHINCNITVSLFIRVNCIFNIITAAVAVTIAFSGLPLTISIVVAVVLFYAIK